MQHDRVCRLSSEMSRGARWRPRRSRCPLWRWSMVAAIGTLSTLAAEPASATPYTWTDGDLGNSNWSDPDNWSPSGPPAFGDDVTIPAPTLLGSPGPAVLDVSPASMANVDINEDLLGSSAGELQMLAGSSLVILAGTLHNDGLVTVNSDGGTAAARLRFSSYSGDYAVTLDGNGTIVLNAGAGSFPTQEPASIETIVATVTQEAGHTIRGVGRITAGMVNNGTILAADMPSAPGANVLEISDGSTGITNNNVLGAEAGATLDVVGTKFITQGAAGAIQADDGGVVQFRNSVYVSGGSLETKGTGLIRTNSGVTRLTDVTNEGVYQIGGAGGNPPTTRVDGSGLTDNGQINNYTTLDYLTSGALDGTGELVLVNSAASLAAQSGAVITHGADHTISGAGAIGAELINNGVITAAGGTLQIQQYTKTNNYQMRAASGGTLKIQTQVTQGSGGSIIAEDGGTVQLNTGSCHIIGGTLSSQGSGAFTVTASAPILEDVVNEAAIRLEYASTALGVEGAGITNNGTITLNPLSDSAARGLTFIGDPHMTLGGSGTVTLNGQSSVMTVLLGDTLTNVATHTIEGSGKIRGELINEGTITGSSSINPMQIEGRLSGTGPLKNVRITGTHAPGNSAAQVDVTGLYQIAAGGTLEIELGGLALGTQYDHIEVAGTAELDGTLEVQLAGGYMPTPNTGFSLILATGGITGTFANEVLPDLYGGLRFDVQYTSGQVALGYSGVLGDYNYDGTVDAADYTVWRDTLGQTGAALAADGDGSGTVDAADYGVWKSNYGQTAGSGTGSLATTTAVPEPSALWLLLAGLAGALRERHCGHHRRG